MADRLARGGLDRGHAREHREGRLAADAPGVGPGVEDAGGAEDPDTGLGEQVGARLKELSPRFTGSKKINVVYQKLGYLTRSGDPDAIEFID